MGVAVQDVILGRVAYYLPNAGRAAAWEFGRARALGVTSSASRSIERADHRRAGLLQRRRRQARLLRASAAADLALGLQISRRQAAGHARKIKVGVAPFEDNLANFQKFFRADIEKWKNREEYELKFEYFTGGPEENPCDDASAEAAPSAFAVEVNGSTCAGCLMPHRPRTRIGDGPLRGARLPRPELSEDIDRLYGPRAA
jgi:hypothetical protein